jgi:arylsulfatase
MKRTISALALMASMVSVTAAFAQSAQAPAPVVVPQAENPQSVRPNVLVWMLDDVGFAQLSCFAGLVQTPNIDRVARMGLRYSNYHTAPICSASRASLLTGRMPHSVHVGGHAAAARSLPGYDADIPAADGTIAANLHQAGYATFALGKWDHLPTAEITPAGPFNHWPTGQGFDQFYGFLSADMDNWNPTLLHNLTPVRNPADPNYHLNHDLADQAIAMIGSRDSRVPMRPFFLYWATGTAHAPHHAPKEWIERYKGKFDMGWDKVRDQILKAEIAQGLVPKGTELAPRPEGMPAWDALNAEQKRLYAHQMEVFAAALSYADYEFGRILDALQARGELDNTLLIITSDNGASAEGAPNGTYSEHNLASGQVTPMADNMKFFDRWGGPQTYPHYSWGWALAGDTPFRYYKQTTHEGGTHVPLIVSWPKGIGARGELRGQFVHVSDIAPTILAATGVSLAATINNVPQNPMEGQDVTATFADARAPGHQGPQYVEMYGNKGLWENGWAIVTNHRFRTWDISDRSPVNEPWALYDLTKDPGEVHDLAARYPDKVAQMNQAFEEQARRFHVNPIGNIGDALPEMMGKAHLDFEQRGGKWRYAGPIGNITGQMAPPMTARSFAMTAKLDLPAAPITGPVFAYGGQLGGMGLYLREGRPVFLMTSLQGETAEVAASEALPGGATTIELDVVRPNPASLMATAATSFDVAIKAGDRVLAQRKLDFPLPYSFGIAETFGVAIDDGSPLLAGTRSGMPFAGKISDVVFDFSGGR